LESLVCLPAIDRLFTQMGRDIGLVILSDRFGSKRGGPIRQFLASVRQSGLRLTVWLGFDILAAQTAGLAGACMARLTGRQPRLASVRLRAKYHGATVLDVADVNASASVAALRDYAPDFVLVMNFDQILRQDFLAAAAGRVINVHPSLLPTLRGPCPTFWALGEGHSEVGVSIHFIDDERIDAGPVLIQRARPLDRKLSAAEITASLFEEGAGLVPDVVKALRVSRYDRKAQDVTGASYRGFPARAEMKRARGQGVRLCRIRHIARLLGEAAGLVSRRQKEGP
jgi:folate-dependent phosphoribosylglycinamide formyltransferase PurN